jgi:membrane protein CcdC involved in cytochrome C biogenesis
MNVYNWIQANRTKWYAIISIVALVIFVFTKSAPIRNFSLGALLGAMIYFIVIAFRGIINWKKAK